VQAITDARGGELTADELLAEFHHQYLDITRPYEIVSYTHSSGEHDQITAQVAIDGQLTELHGSGNGPIAALVDAFDRQLGIQVQVLDYHEHAMASGADATAAAYVEADIHEEAVWGVSVHPSIITASLHAIANAINRRLVITTTDLPQVLRCGRQDGPAQNPELYPRSVSSLTVSQ
jgi:2-isopropylmalate synthase